MSVRCVCGNNDEPVVVALGDGYICLHAAIVVETLGVGQRLCGSIDVGRA
jgi:hypothetical protein